MPGLAVHREIKVFFGAYETEQEFYSKSVILYNLFKGLFINDVIIFGGYRDPPPSSRVTRDITDFATKQRMLDF